VKGSFQLPLVFVGYCHGDVDHGQKHENVGLNDGNGEVQPQKNRWRQKRDQRKEDDSEQVAGQHVGVKTDGERHHARQVRYDLDGKQQRRHPPDRTGKLLEVADWPLFAHAMEVVIDERKHGDAERNRGLAGGRDQDWKEQADEIVEQDEEADAGDEGLEALIAGADDLVALDARELVDHLGDLLRRVRLFDGQREAHDDEERDEQQRDGKLESEGVVKGRARNGGMIADGLEDLRGDSAKDGVKKVGECEFGFHENASSCSMPKTFRLRRNQSVPIHSCFRQTGAPEKPHSES
jgi:hypothetical protein